MDWKQGFRIGARIHDLLQDSQMNMSAALQESSVECVQLTLPKFVSWSESPQNYSMEKIQKIQSDFQRAGVEISVLSCYVNPLAENVKKEQDTFYRFIDYAAAMGVQIVGTETGSVVSDLREYKKNHTEENFVRLVEALRPMLDYAADRGVMVGIESVAYYPVHNENTFARLKSVFPKASVCCIFDPTNLLHIGNYQQQREVFERFIQMHFKDIRIVHLKDFIVRNDWLEERPLFEGELDVECVIELLQKYKVNADFIVENAESVGNYKEIKKRLETLFKEVRKWK